MVVAHPLNGFSTEPWSPLFCTGISNRIEIELTTVSGISSQQSAVIGPSTDICLLTAFS